MKITYQDFNFRRGTLALIEQIGGVVDEYIETGDELTLRQLYYQFVARDLFPEDRRWSLVGGKWKRDPNGTKNAEPNYKWLGKITNDARLAGMLDWNIMVDRTRQIKINNHWDSPSDIIEYCVEWYARDTRESQPVYVEVWIEKEALAGILERACKPLDVSYFACKGFVSQSAMWRAGRRIIQEMQPSHRERAVVLHLGDHDPSGIDMTRDIQDRLDLFGAHAEVNRIALNMNQVEELNPPPNPAKVTDSRYEDYRAEFGEESWELDALDPRTLNDLITREVNDLTDEEKRDEIISTQEEQREKLQAIADNFDNLDV